MSQGGRMLTVEDFAPRRGKTFSAETTAGAIPLLLAEVQELPASGRDGGAFRLEFQGPLQPFLPQATYPLGVDRDRFDIFLVPLGPQGARMRYEAIFF